MSKHLKNIGFVSFLTAVSRVLGLVRDSLGTAIFGAGVLYSAFLTAFVIPNLFRRLLAEGSLTAAFVPTLQHEMHSGGRSGAFALLSKVTSWLLVVAGGFALLAMVALSQSRLIPGEGDKWYIAADLTVLLFPYLALIALAAACNAALNVLGKFTEPALSPIWLNLAMIASLGGAGLHFARTPIGEVHWLCAGVLAGGFLQMAVPAGVLVTLGWRPRFDLHLAPAVREIARLMTPGLFGTAIYQINLAVSRLLAFSLNDSAATLYFNGNRLMEFPIGVFAIAVSTVVYPLIARHAAEGNASAMAEDYRKGMRLILIINVPAAAGLMVLRHPIIDLIYRHGHFTAANANDLAHLVLLFAIGLPFFSVVNLTVRAFYSVKDTSTPVKVAAIDFAVNVTLCVSLMGWLGVSGLVIASTAAIVLQTILLQRSLARRLPGLTFRPLWRSLAKVLLATLVMAAGAEGGWQLLQGLALHRTATELLAVAALIPVAVAIYGAMLWILHIEGREELAAIWKRMRTT